MKARKIKAIPQEKRGRVYPIVQEILRQCKCEINVWWSWGSHKVTACVSDDEYEMPCLAFAVQGFKFKGTVRVFLNEGSDTYEV